MSASDVIETLAIVLAAGLASELVAGLLRIPRMVVLVAAGAVLGPDVAGALDLPPDSIAVELLLTLGVSLILFYGGLNLSFRVLRRVALGLGLLVVPGVVLTAMITGAAAALAFDVPLEVGLLVGAVLAPTDPAILIPLFERLRVRPKVSQTIVAESALNDVTGAVLALSLAAFVVEGGGSLASPLREFLLDLLLSSALGLAFGGVLAIAISDRRLGLWRESPAIAALLVVTGSFFTIDYAGGSGYLGAFIAGLVVSNMDTLGLGLHSGRETELRTFTQAATDVLVILVFIMLGANLPLDSLADEALPALATLAVLIVVARPLTVLACLLPDRAGRWRREEVLFLSWTRETGAMPAALVGVLAADGVGYESELATVVALAIIVTLLLQSTTKAWLARRLGLDDGTAPSAAEDDPDDRAVTVS
ncbi:MAG TPA: sodium:proton antiporter [Gaiellaceae bacterium]|nr:sodium:proton antiporter [Gaiellaceae bacterium]